MTVKSLMAENPDPSEAEVRAALSSNLCRCTGYSQMVCGDPVGNCGRAERST